MISTENSHSHRLTIGLTHHIQATVLDECLTRVGENFHFHPLIFFPSTFFPIFTQNR